MIVAKVGSASIYLTGHQEFPYCICIGDVFIHGTPASMREFARRIELETAEVEAKAMEVAAK